MIMLLLWRLIILKRRILLANNYCQSIDCNLSLTIVLKSQFSLTRISHQLITFLDMWPLGPTKRKTKLVNRMSHFHSEGVTHRLPMPPGFWVYFLQKQDFKNKFLNSRELKKNSEKFLREKRRIFTRTEFWKILNFRIVESDKEVG